MRTISIILLLISLSGKFIAGETVTDARRQMQMAVAELNAPLFTSRIKSLRALTTILDASMLNEFKLIDRVKEIAENSAEAVNVRTEALNTLAVFNANGIEVSRYMDLLNKIIKNDKEDNRVICAALMQMVNAVPAYQKGTAANVDRDRVFATLKELYDKRKKSPQQFPEMTALALINALSNFGDKDGTQKMLIETATNQQEKIPEIRTAAARALRNSITAIGAGDKKTATELEAQLNRHRDDSARELRMVLLECLESILAQANNNYTPNANTREIALALLNNGNDEEIIAAVNFLMRLSTKDAKITDELLPVALPSATRTISFKALEHANAALVNVLYNIGNDKKNAAEAQKIINHILDLLNPNLLGVPEEIKETLLMGLGIIPDTFERERAVICLLDLLTRETDKEAPLPGRVGQIEDALTALTGMVPFKKIAYNPVENANTPNAVQMQKKVTPDLVGWDNWLEKNKDKLKGK